MVFCKRTCNRNHHKGKAYFQGLSGKSFDDIQMKVVKMLLVLKTYLNAGIHHRKYITDTCLNLDRQVLQSFILEIIFFFRPGLRRLLCLNIMYYYVLLYFFSSYLFRTDKIMLSTIYGIPGQQTR